MSAEPQIESAVATGRTRLAGLPAAARARTHAEAGLPELLCGPLIERFRRGEGALLAVNLCWVAFAWPGAGVALAQAAVSALVLAVAYAVNDWHDARGDLSDPKKRRRLVLGLIERRRPVGIALVLLHVALVAAAALGIGSAAALAVAAMLGINVAYSWLLKGIPILDLVVVGLWGAAFVAIVGAPGWLCVTVGLMTAIMHLFQIEQDRSVDAVNAIRTTAVRLPSALHAALALICLLLAFMLLPRLGPVGAATALVPLALRLAVKQNAAAWMACRVYCGVVLVATFLSHGPG